ncbi:RNA polymerase sigma factor [Patescibacteria group bacterium]|nr:MAG: RNA polymerase sigma factor [Patescibacteria group bacterium]
MKEKDTEGAFLLVFREHHDSLFRHAFFRTGSRERALDLTQDTFIKAWDYVRGGGEIKQFKAFLYKIMRNLIIDEYRRKKTQSLDDMSEEKRSFVDAELAEGSVWETETHIDEQDLILKVQEQLPKLPPQYCAVITMRFIDGFSPKEIADITGDTENVISVRLHRAITKLRTMLSYEN